MTRCHRISTLLGHVADLEKKSAELYAFYAEVFEDTPEAAGMFLQLKREEQAHLNQALFKKRIVDKTPLRYPDIDIDISPIVHLIEAIETHISGGVFSVSDATRFALSLEESAVEIHYRTLAEKVCTELNELSAFLKNSDEAHIQKLLDFEKRIEGNA